MLSLFSPFSWNPTGVKIDNFTKNDPGPAGVFQQVSWADWRAIQGCRAAVQVLKNLGIAQFGTKGGSKVGL